MSIEEQETFKGKWHAEALRYMDNAKDSLKKAGKDGLFYNDRKYVRTACGTAYNGVLIALDAYLQLHGIQKTKGRKSIDYYQNYVGKVDRKLLTYLNGAYEILHLFGYYDGATDTRVVKAGFDNAYFIINKIKP